MLSGSSEVRMAAKSEIFRFGVLDVSLGKGHCLEENRSPCD